MYREEVLGLAQIAMKNNKIGLINYTDHSLQYYK
jgi:hypothetical protein